ncbi:MAG TPA: hypothetical protein VI542_37040, partial [Candidatus Tectomicrobia bacterium]
VNPLIILAETFVPKLALSGIGVVGIACPSDEGVDHWGVVIPLHRSDLWVAGLRLTLVIGDEAVPIGRATGPRARVVFLEVPQP